MPSIAKEKSVDVEKAQFNMIQQQVRPWDVLDESVLAVMEATPRAHFVPEAFQKVAFADIMIPLPNNQVMLPPKIIGRCLQALNLKSHENILEIGTGSGYLTALAAQLCHRIHSIDIHADLTNKARETLRSLNILNAILDTKDGFQLNPKQQTYDAIIVTGSTPLVPKSFRELLNTDGRLFVIVGQEPMMTAMLVTRLDNDEWFEQPLFETSIPCLEGAPVPEQFLF